MCRIVLGCGGLEFGRMRWGACSRPGCVSGRWNRHWTTVLMEPWPPGAASLSQGPSEAVPAPRNSSVTLNHCAEIQWLASLSQGEEKGGRAEKVIPIPGQNSPHIRQMIPVRKQSLQMESVFKVSPFIYT